MSGPALGKVQAGHLARAVRIYVRQSTLHQTRVNTESLARQYELADRARELGWTGEQVRVIDADLGLSGARAPTGKASRSWLPRWRWARSG